jgi:hypothetical protein
MPPTPHATTKSRHYFLQEFLSKGSCSTQPNTLSTLYDAFDTMQSDPSARVVTKSLRITHRVKSKRSSSERRDQVTPRIRGYGDEATPERPPLMKWNSSGGEMTYRRRLAPGPCTPRAESQPTQSAQSALVQDRSSQAKLCAARSTPVHIHLASAQVKEAKSPSFCSIDKLVHQTPLCCPFKRVPAIPCVVKRKPVPKALPPIQFAYIEPTPAWLLKPTERLIVIHEYILHGTSDKSPQLEEVWADLQYKIRADGRTRMAAASKTEADLKKAMEECL